MVGEEEIKTLANKDAFASIAIWQILTFIALLLMIWVNETLDIPARVFGAVETPFSLYRACMLSAAVITAGVVVVGHTYEKQRTLLRKLLETCMYCHRVRVPKGDWEHVEVYFIKHYPVSMARGVCPACEEMLESVEAKADAEEG